MDARFFRLLALLVLLLLPAAAREEGGAQAHWPQFRGPGAAGVAEGLRLPDRWDAEAGTNLLWKTPIPGLGHSSPVVWGDRVFVTTAVSGREDAGLRVGLYGDIRPVEDDTVHRWLVYCVDRKTGRVLWERAAHTGVPKVRRHTKATHANSTMATDGKHAVAFFGSEGLYCYNMEGRLLWKKDLGLLDSGYFAVPAAQWGFASSPVIHAGRVLVQCDVQKGSFLAAFDVRDGREIWRTPRQDVPTWSTPAVVRAGGRTQVAVNGYRHIGGYDFATGRELWRLRGGGDIPVPTPVAAHGLIFITNAHGRQAPIYAVRATAEGDITPAEEETTNAHLAWSQRRDGGYMQTPLVYGDELYVCRDNGVLGCYDARTGARHYQERLGTGRTGFTASPVAADGRIYFTSEEGDVHVLRAGPRFERLGVNPLGAVCLTTPALVEGAFLFRTQGHLLAVGSRPAR